MNKSSTPESENLTEEELRREVMKGVEEIRNGQGIVYQSAEELAEAIINRGKTRKAKQHKTD